MKGSKKKTISKIVDILRYCPEPAPGEYHNGAVEMAGGIHLSMLPNNHLCWDSLGVKARAAASWAPHTNL